MPELTEGFLPEPADTDLEFRRSERALSDTGVGAIEVEQDFEGIVVPEEEKETPSVFESFGEAVLDTGWVTGGAKALSERSGLDTTFDPAFDLEAHIEGNPEHQKYLQKHLDNMDTPASGALWHNLMDAKNAQHADWIIERAKEHEESLETSLANGLGPYITGTIGGIGLDIGALIGLSATTGGGSLPLLGTRLASMPRTVGAIRAAIIGGLEGGGERLVQSLSDPLVTSSEVLENLGFGVAGGALLGSLFPNFVGGVKRLADDVEPRPGVDQTIDEAKAWRDSQRGAGDAGAAVPEDIAAQRRINVPERGSEGLRAGRLFGNALGDTAANRFLRNPKRWLVSKMVQGNKEFIDEGRLGNRIFGDVMSRLVRISTAMVGEKAGASGIARARSVQEARDDLYAVRAARQHEAAVEYFDMMKDLFGVGKWRSAALNSATLGKFRHEERIGTMISQDEFENIANRYAIARGDELLEDVGDGFIPQAIKDRLDVEQLEKLKDHVVRHADGEDAFYMKFGLMEVKHGLLKHKDGTPWTPEEIKPGYRPQRWNIDAINARKPEFKLWLLEAFQKTPDDDWVNTSYKVPASEAENAPLVGIMNEGETFAEFAKREPAKALEITDDWAAGVKQAQMDMVEKIRNGRVIDLKKATSEVAKEVRARITGNITKLRPRLEKLKGNKPENNPDEIEAWATRVGKMEKRLADEEAKLKALDEAVDQEARLSVILMKFGNKAQKAKVKQARDRLKNADRNAAVAAARKTATQQVDDVVANITSGKGFVGMVDNIQTSSRFKRRLIHLGISRFDEQADDFLLTGTADARAAFTSSVGTQLAMREVFAPLLRARGVDFGDSDIADAVRAHAMSGFDDDLAKVKPGTKEHKAILKEQKAAGEFVDRLLAEVTHADITALQNTARGAHDTVSIINTATAASTLGSILLAQLGDTAVMMLAGGQLGTGFRFAWRGGRAGKHLKEILEDDAELGVLLYGLSTFDGSRFRNLADTDRLEFDIPGGKMRSVMRVTDEVATIEGWANLMHVWNKYVRGGFGLDFARQIDNDLGRWDQLPAHLKTFYSRHGIDADTAAKMSDLLSRKHKAFVGGKLRIPDSSAWGDEAPELLEKWRVLIKSAGDEAMLDPGVGDRPFLRATSYGRILLQFQSFMFTAGERFIAPMTQELMMHPSSVRPYAAAIAGLFLGGMTDALKSGVRGELDAWLDTWDDEDKWTDNLWGAVMRSPMMAGPSALLIDTLSSQFGRPMNELIGSNVFKQSSTRLREAQGIMGAVAGPFGGMLNTGATAVRKTFEGAVSGDVDQLYDGGAMIARRTPVLNVFYLSILNQIMKDNL